MARFEKLKKWKEDRMIKKTKQLWDAGYNSLEISIKLGKPIDDVQDWIKQIVAAERVAQ